MKKTLRIFAIVVTSGAIATTAYLATLESPTDIQKQLFTTSSALALPSKGNRRCRHNQYLRPIER